MFFVCKKTLSSFCCKKKQKLGDCDFPQTPLNAFLVWFCLALQICLVLHRVGCYLCVQLGCRVSYHRLLALLRGNYFGYCIVWFGLIVQFWMGAFVCCRLGGLRFPPNPLKRFSCVYSLLLRSLFGCIGGKGLVLFWRFGRGDPSPTNCCR